MSFECDVLFYMVYGAPLNFTGPPVLFIGGSVSVVLTLLVNHFKHQKSGRQRQSSH